MSYSALIRYLLFFSLLGYPSALKGLFKTKNLEIFRRAKVNIRNVCKRPIPKMVIYKSVAVSLASKNLNSFFFLLTRKHFMSRSTKKSVTYFRNGSESLKKKRTYIHNEKVPPSRTRAHIHPGSGERSSSTDTPPRHCSYRE